MTHARVKGLVAEVFRAFLMLGLSSFGGPIAHLAYFRREFVERRCWVTDSQYAQLLALCQLLPGPTSSQMGFALGLQRAGFPGAFAAFAGFSLPSALLMLAFATLFPSLTGALGLGIVHGLKLVAVAVVAHGAIGMRRTLCPDWPRMSIAVMAAVLMLALGQSWAPLLIVGLGALVGLRYCVGARVPQEYHMPARVGVGLGWTLLVVFFCLLFALPLFASPERITLWSMASFYRAGALVFGGGHVVLPLLKESMVDTGIIPADTFLAGYGAAQAIPGPMFTLAAYLGACLPGTHGGVLGAGIAVLMIFLPGMLLVSGLLALWHKVGDTPHAARAIAGVNAAVLGLLIAVLYNPIWTSGIRSGGDVVIALLGLLLLARWRLSALWVVLLCVGSSVLLPLMTHR